MKSLSEYCAERGLEGLLTEWDVAANAPATPESAAGWSGRKARWVCEKGHRWAATAASRVAGAGCPYCAGQRPIPGETDLAATHPALARQWHPEKNGGLTPADVSAGSHKRVVWRCDRGHEWTAPVNRRTGGSGCPYCAGLKPIVGETDLATRCPEIAREWDAEKNYPLTPQQVMPRSKAMAWWVCPKGHSYRASIRSRGGNGTGCPYCAGAAVLPGSNDLATRYPALAREWYQPLNGDLTPEAVTPGSNKRAAWRCCLGHVWYARIDSRAAGGRGCPLCAGQHKKARLTRYDRLSPLRREKYGAAMGK